MGCIVSKLFFDFYIFFIFTRPLTWCVFVCRIWFGAGTESLHQGDRGEHGRSGGGWLEGGRCNTQGKQHTGA